MNRRAEEAFNEFFKNANRGSRHNREFQEEMLRREAKRQEENAKYWEEIRRKHEEKFGPNSDMFSDPFDPVN